MQFKIGNTFLPIPITYLDENDLKYILSILNRTIVL